MIILGQLLEEGNLFSGWSFICFDWINLDASSRNFIAFMPALWVGAGMLMIMDASFNIAMEPFRALVGDNLRVDQHTLGFSIQTALIGFGAVLGSWLPYVLTNWFGISNQSSMTSAVPQNLIYSFSIGQ